MANVYVSEETRVKVPRMYFAIRGFEVLATCAKIRHTFQFRNAWLKHVTYLIPGAWEGPVVVMVLDIHRRTGKHSQREKINGKSCFTSLRCMYEISA
jgi:hypothetical protein